ncbi:MAG: MFS transporter [Anaerolineae bacterium]|nr:MFS transporter [Anaerolineae bacterium]
MPTDRTKPFYGWYITLTLALTETISWGILYYVFSVFLTPMEQELGWSRAELTGGFSLMLLVAGGMAFPAGAWIDRHGARLLMTAGSAAACLLVIAWSAVSTLPAFYAIWIGLGVCAAAVLYDPAFTVVAHWFVRRRSTALVVITFAAGLASTIFLPLSDALLVAFGWRVAVLILGLFLGAVTIPLHLLILRRRPEDLGLLPDGETQSIRSKSRAAGDVTFRKALTGRTFWLLTLGFGLFYLAAAALRVHFIPFLIGSGFDSSTAAYATGAIGIMQVGGRVVFAPLERRFSTRTMILLIFALQAAAQAVLLAGHAPLLIAAFILLFGAAQGAGTLVRPAILAALYGAANFGRIASVMTIFLTLASTAAPLFASLLYDRAGSYQPVVVLVVAISAAATGVAALAHRSILGAVPETSS